jgi:ribonuclease R
VHLKKKLLEGLIKRHPDGFGFFIPDDKEHPDVYIPRHSMSSIMTGDRVSVEVFPESGGERFRGEIRSILTRGMKQVVGIFSELNAKEGMLKDEAKAWGQDLKIKLEDSLNAKPGQSVFVEITSYPEDKIGLRGRVIEVLGDINDPLSDIRRVIFSNQIPNQWPASVLKEAQLLKHNPEEKDFQGRKDIRALNLITIDGATAKDFDDAVFVESNPRGFRLLVAIADVSHYVRPGTAIDDEAYNRGTSVYFPNFVVPMLPEVLSNGLCSLNPKVPRLCVVADMQFDFVGEMIESTFYEAVMESKARVTYGQAQEVIDGTVSPELAHVKHNILVCADLAKILMAKRFKEGSLDLELPETELVIDSTGTPIDIIRSERLFSHRLIEEMMLAANVAVAKFLSSKEIPAVYRIHEPPPEEAIQKLEKFLWNFGGHVRLEGGKLQKRLTQALREFDGKPEAHVLNILTLRSMSQAKYSAHNLGHFGLGFEFYTHFTSPIRRYPDLIVHRLLKSQVVQKSGYQVMEEGDLSTAATFLSACEQRSTKAERQIQSIKKARFVEKLIGQTFNGMISSIAKFGIFVLLREYDVDGLIRLEDLGERFEFDEENLRLVAKGSGFSYNMGDEIEVTVVSSDIQLGQINFALGGEAGKKAASRPKRSFEKREGRSEQNDRPGRHQKNRNDRKNRNEGGRRNDRSDKTAKKNTREEPAWVKDKKSGRRGSRGPDRSSDRGPEHSSNRSENRGENRSAQPASRQNPTRGARPQAGPADRNARFDRPVRAETKEEAPVKAGKKGIFQKLMSMDVDSSPRSVLKGIKASYRSRENFGGSRTKPDRKDPEKRSETPDDRGGVRKTRVPQRRRKG